MADKLAYNRENLVLRVTENWHGQNTSLMATIVETLE